MKIIDLLNKIANGEEVPETIKFGCKEYVYKKDEEDFLSYFDVYNNCIFENYTLDDAMLNKEIEIIEEDKKIEKIKSLNNVGSCQDLIEFQDKQQLNNHILKDKINEIIEETNKLKDDRK